MRVEFYSKDIGDELTFLAHPTLPAHSTEALAMSIPVLRAVSAVCALAVFGLSGCGSDSSTDPASTRELISNGSFETPAVADTTYNFFQIYTGTSTAITGWTTGDVDLVHRKYWTAASGNQSIDLNSTSAGWVARRVDSKAGSRYTLSFSIATVPGLVSGSPDIRVCRVLWNNVPVDTFSVERVTPMAWTRIRIDLVAQGNDSLRIESISAGRAGVALDSVSLMGP